MYVGFLEKLLLLATLEYNKSAKTEKKTQKFQKLQKQKKEKTL